MLLVWTNLSRQPMCYLFGRISPASLCVVCLDEFLPPAYVLFVWTNLSRQLIPASLCAYGIVIVMLKLNYKSQ